MTTNAEAIIESCNDIITMVGGLPVDNVLTCVIVEQLDNVFNELVLACEERKVDGETAKGK